jgi:protein involved in polysaccharide export with SLBB domain
MENRKVRAALGGITLLIASVLAGFLVAGCRSSNQTGYADIPELPATPVGVEPASTPPSSPLDAAGSGSTASTPVEVSSQSPLADPPAHFSATNLTTNGNSRANVIIRVGEILKISFTDMVVLIPPIEDRVREDGTITLLYNKVFKVAGKTVGDFQKEIRDTYVPDYFVQMTPNVISLVRQERYFVDGEVKIPSEKPYVGRITVTQAITGCGGFTDFAKKTRVQLIRADGTIETIDCKKAIKNPKLDREVMPGDKIYVPRTLGF